MVNRRLDRMEIEVLFEYSAADYRCIICTQQSKLCRDIEYHLRQVGVAEPEVAVLSYTANRERFEERTRFFLQRWDIRWRCYVNIDSLEEVVDGDRLTVVRTSVWPEKAAADTEASPSHSNMIRNSGSLTKHKKKDMKKKTVAVKAVLLEKFQENVPKKSSRVLLEQENKIKKLFVTRADTHNDLDKRIRWVFGVDDYTFLECTKGGNKLIVSSNQHMDGLDAIHRRGSLYLCKGIDKVSPRARVTADFDVQAGPSCSTSTVQDADSEYILPKEPNTDTSDNDDDLPAIPTKKICRRRKHVPYIVVSDDSDNEDAPSHASSREIIRLNPPSQKMDCSDKQQDAIDKFSEQTDTQTEIDPYQHFINMLSDESDGDGLQEVDTVRNHDQSTSGGRDDSASLSLENILKIHFEAIPGFQPIEDAEYEEFNNIHVRHNHIWSDALRSISKTSFNPLAPIRVTFIGEAGIDEGGPRREFFSLALSKMAEDSTIFHGPTNARSFVRNVEGIRKRKFFLAGLFVALSLANGGQGFDCLSETVYSYLCYGLYSGKIVSKVDDIADNLIKEHLLKTCQVKETAVLQELLLENDAQYIRDCGFIKPVVKVTLEDLKEIKEAVCIEYLIMKSINEIQQFQEGLDVLGMGKLLKGHPFHCRELFTHNPKVVTGYDLDKLFLPILSNEGSNMREKEEAIVMNWKDYIYDQGSKVTATQILAFATGATKPPPMGFPIRPTITFIVDQSCTLPTASTCSLTIRLPLALVDYEQFKDRMSMAILNTVGFGQV